MTVKKELAWLAMTGTCNFISCCRWEMPKLRPFEVNKLSESSVRRTKITELFAFEI